jgi:hypothetical protein
MYPSRSKNSVELILFRTRYGRYVYWEGLEILDFIQKGKRHASQSWHAKTINAALIKMHRLEIEVLKNECR